MLYLLRRSDAGGSTRLFNRNHCVELKSCEDKMGESDAKSAFRTSERSRNNEEPIRLSRNARKLQKNLTQETASFWRSFRQNLVLWRAWSKGSIFAAEGHVWERDMIATRNTSCRMKAMWLTIEEQSDEVARIFPRIPE